MFNDRSSRIFLKKTSTSIFTYHPLKVCDGACKTQKRPRCTRGGVCFSRYMRVRRLSRQKGELLQVTRLPNGGHNRVFFTGRPTISSCVIDDRNRLSFTGSWTISRCFCFFFGNQNKLFFTGHWTTSMHLLYLTNEATKSYLTVLLPWV